MNAQLPDWIAAVLSPSRFAPYVDAVNGDVDAAIALYQWNLDAAAAFLVPLHWAETAMRNAVNDRLRAMFGRREWWLDAPLDANGRGKIVEAHAALRRRAADGTNPDSVVAELTWGFWVSLLASRYHRTLWVPGLTRTFPGSKRADVHEDYRHVLALRNRVMHYEPIHGRHLEADHATLCRLIGQLSKEAGQAAVAHGRVGQVLARRVRA